MQYHSFFNRFFLFVVTCISVAVFVRYSLLGSQDSSHCGAVLNHGMWLDRPVVDDHKTVPKKWEPPNCTMHRYKPSEASACFSGRRILFIGDSTIRRVFWGIARKFDPNVLSDVRKHVDITLEIGEVTLEFVWDPFLNSSRVIEELDLFKGQSYYGQDPKRPSLMLMGTGLWYARYELNAIKKWRDTIDEVAKRMRFGRATTDLTFQDLLLLSPVVVPVWSWLDEDRKRTITQERVKPMNAYLRELSNLHGIDVAFAFNEMTAGLTQTYESSGIHITDAAALKQADILVNMRCNAIIQTKYPYDATCCYKYERPNFHQWTILIAVLVGFPVLWVLKPKVDENKGDNLSRWLPSENTIYSLLVFGIVVVFCFCADRTVIFNKFHKHYNTQTFLLLNLLWICIGFVTITRSSTSRTDQQFLFRDQTDEWKGWMQFAILVYHYTGASKVVWIYGLIRVTVASYLFMTGYGHTIYFYKKDDYSFKRVASVLVRLNLLSCILPYIMKTEYDFYYFAPLVSFWFMVIFFTMYCGAKYNGNTRFLIGKIVFSAVFTTGLTKIPGILESGINILHFFTKIEWNVPEWRFRVSLDMWIVYVGMIVAIVFMKLSDCTSSYNLSFPEMRRYAIVASATALPTFFLFQTTRETKYVYNRYHPYISWIPILSFIVLRNATAKLRNTYCGAFAWLGRCSLETFTLQFHIWLAGDTHSILDFGLFDSEYRFENFVVATILFLFASHHVANATGVLTAWIMGGERKPEKAATLRTPSQLPISNRDMEVATGEETEKLNNGNDNERQDIELLAVEGSSQQPPQVQSPSELQPPVQKNGKLGLYFKNPKLRVAVVLAGMWVFNMTYQP